jgi:acyl-coenzyme A thioesterase PaaI-like protein
MGERNELSIDVRDGVLPWTRTCFVCGEANAEGFRLKSRVEQGIVVLDYTPQARDLGYRHLVHGGIAMTLLDEVMTWAAILGLRSMCVAAEMTTRLCEPMAAGERLRIEGWLSGGRKRLVTTTGTIRDGAGTTLATASGKYMPMPEGGRAECAEDFVTGAGSLTLSDVFGEEGS